MTDSFTYLTGLVAAPQTPMHADGGLNLGAVEHRAARLLGIECGPVRPPVRRLTKEQRTQLLPQVEGLGILQITPKTQDDRLCYDTPSP